MKEREDAEKPGGAKRKSRSNTEKVCPLSSNRLLSHGRKIRHSIYKDVGGGPARPGPNGNSAMFVIEADREKHLMVISYSQRVTSEEARAAGVRVRELLLHFKPGFRVLTDMR